MTERDKAAITVLFVILVLGCSFLAFARLGPGELFVGAEDGCSVSDLQLDGERINLGSRAVSPGAHRLEAIVEGVRLQKYIQVGGEAYIVLECNPSRISVGT
jgi:hypothetical protein